MTWGIPENAAESARLEASKRGFDPAGRDTDEPYAEVVQVGRWTYRVRVMHGLMQWGPDGYGWTVWGRARAERKAARVLARYVRQERDREHREQNATVVTQAEGTTP